MRSLAVMGSAVLLAWASAGAARDVRVDPASVAGRYSRDFQGQMVNGDRYPASDVLEIVPLGPERAYVRVHLDFYNGHLCDISGVAHVEAQQLVYRSKQTPDCELHVGRSGAKMLIDDPTRACSGEYCGARGTLVRQSIPAASRRPIRYMSRLKASPDFKRALAEDRGR